MLNVQNFDILYIEDKELINFIGELYMKQLQANKEQLVETAEQIEIKYFYSNGVEIKRHDLVYLKAYDTRQDALFNRLYKICYTKSINKRKVVRTWRD